MNETQVKKPIEDVINSSKPIQLTNLPSSYDLTSSNYPYPNTSLNYLPSSSTAYTFSYSSNQQTTQTTSLPSDIRHLQSNLSQANNLHQQTSLQNSLPQFNMTQTSSLHHSNLPQNGLNTNIHLANYNQSNLSPNVSSNLTNFQFSGQSSNLINNMTRNLSSNLPANHDDPKNQLTKNNSDINIAQNGQQKTNLQQPNVYNLPFSQPISNPQLTQANLSNYNVYSNSPTTASIRGAYDALNNLNLNLYPQVNQPVSNLTHNLNSLNNQNNLNHHNHTTTNYSNNVNNLNINATAANYVPSPPTTYTNGILLPQQHSFTSTQQSLNSNKVEANNNDSTKSNEKNANKTNQTGNDNSIRLANLKANNKKIDVADFENSSSPFDDALLRSLNDKEELNNVFQQFYSGGK